MVQIRKARRSATKLRLLLAGPSGSGKTWGALSIAKGMGGRTVVIDTEEGSSDLYDHLHEFDVIDLRPEFSPEKYIEAIAAAEAAGYDVIIIDSVTHCWSGPGGCLEILEAVAKAHFRGNTWSAWSVVTPRWRAFVDTILRSPAHVICCGRSKTESTQVDDHGRKKVTKLGMKLEARDGLEYEFTCCLDIIHDGHYATVSKDRTGLFNGDPKPITPDTGRQLAAWLSTGNESPPLPVGQPAGRAKAAPAAQGADESLLDTIKAAIFEATTVARLGRISDRIDELQSDGQLTAEDCEQLEQMVAAKHDEIEPQEATA